MDDVTQIRVGKHMTGIIGLKQALARAADRCKAMGDDQIGEALLEMLGHRNYIENGFRDMYAQALLINGRIGAAPGKNQGLDPSGRC